MRASRILDLARTMRWAIVGGAVRKARAISSVVSPQTSRSVSATCGHRASSAGWQQVKISRSRSSSTASSSPRAAMVRHGVELRRDLGQRAVEPRAPAHRVDGLEAAGRDEPRDGIVRHAFAGPLLDGRRERIVERLFGEVEIAEQADERREHSPGVGAVDVFDLVSRRSVGARPPAWKTITARTPRPAALRRCRSSPTEFWQPPERRRSGRAHR